MKIQINKSKIKAEKPFPKIMISDAGTLVLFLEYGKGVQIPKSNLSEVIYTDGWSMMNFTDFEGSITLSND